MKLTIIRIEEYIVTCQFEDGSLLDISRILVSPDIKEGDEIEVDVQKKIKK